jgi:hypothetical protein
MVISRRPPTSRGCSREANGYVLNESRAFGEAAMRGEISDNFLADWRQH